MTCQAIWPVLAVMVLAAILADAALAGTARLQAKINSQLLEMREVGYWRARAQAAEAQVKRQHALLVEARDQMREVAEAQGWEL